MNEHSKEFQEEAEFRKANLALSDYQKRHNILRKDYELLLEITETHQDDKKKFNLLYRASLRSFFALIESDIFGLNQIDKYDGYSDRHFFEDMFKKTFKKVCKTWKKDDVIREYLDSKFKNLRELKEKRNKLVHPKTTNDIVNGSVQELLELKRAFNDYTKMVHSIMDNFFISININSLEEIEDLFRK